MVAGVTKTKGGKDLPPEPCRLISRKYADMMAWVSGTYAIPLIFRLLFTPF